MAASIEIKNLTKAYDGSMVLNDISFHIKEREFIVFLGPSGCGKSTLLRMIAGLETLSEGEIWMDGKRLDTLAPGHRNISMVFQNYALYPHMSVEENMTFGLKNIGTEKSVIEQRLSEAARILEIEHLLNRKPAELSGGQRQRVAIGRAIVREPSAFLFDEPLSNLDAKLRGVMREEIKQLHRELKTTTIYVTHDQIEAMTLADRIVILKDGYVAQVGTPTEVFKRPANKFVAQFIGNPSMNMLDAKLISEQNEYFILLGDVKIPLPERFKAHASKNLALHFGIRPTDIHLRPEQVDHDRVLPIPVTIKDKELLGASILLRTEVSGQPLTVETQAAEVESKEQTLYVDLDAIHLFDALSEKSLAH